MSHPNITANGSTDFVSLPGRTYTFAFSGDFGGGTLTAYYVQDESQAAFPGFPITNGTLTTATAPSNLIRLTLAGATDPDIEVSIVLSSSSGNASVDELAAETAARVASITLREQIKNAKVLGGLYGRLYTRIVTSGAVITIGNFGDSYAQAPVAQFRRDWGGSWGSISAITASFVRSGGAVMAATDYTKNLNGNSVDLTAGQSVQLPNYEIGSRLLCVYQVAPSAGTFKIQYEANKSGTWVDALTVDGAVSVNGANAAAMAVSTQTPATYRVRALGVSGTVRILGLGIDFGNTSANRPGVRVVEAQLGGTSVGMWSTPAQHIWDAYFGGANGVPPDLAFFKGDDDATQWTTNFPSLVTKLRAAAPNSEIVIQGRHPTTGAPSNTELHADDIAIGALAEANNWIYVNSRLFFPDAATAQAQGLLRSDDGGVHLVSSTGTRLQDRVTYDHLYPLNRPILNLASANGSDKAFLSGVNGVRTPDDSFIPEWKVGGALNLYVGRIGLERIDSGSAINPGQFFGLETTELAAGSTTHKGGMAWRINDLTRLFFNSAGNGLIGGGNYNPSNITRTLTDALTILNGANGQGGINLGIKTSPHSNTVPFQVREDASITAVGTQVMRMNKDNQKWEYLGGGADALTGSFTLLAGVATINTTAAATNDHVNITLVTPGGTMGARYKVTITNGTSLTITAVDLTGATVTTDTSSGTWEIAKGRF